MLRELTNTHKNGGNMIMHFPFPVCQLQQLLTEPLHSSRIFTTDYCAGTLRHYIISFKSPKSKHLLTLDSFYLLLPILCPHLFLLTVDSETHTQRMGRAELHRWFGRFKTLWCCPPSGFCGKETGFSFSLGSVQQSSSRYIIPSAPALEGRPPGAVWSGSE